jgi:hypothetical protein
LNLQGSSRILGISVLFVLIFVSATTVLDTYAKKIIVKKPPIHFGKGLTEPLAKRTKPATEVQIEELKIAKLPFKSEYRGDLIINVDKKTHELYTDLLNTLMGNMVGIFRYLIS